MERLKNIENKNKEQLKAIEDKNEEQLEEIKNLKADSKSLKAISFFSELSPKTKKLLDELKKENNAIDSKKCTCAIFDGTVFDLSAFKKSLDFASNIYRKGKISLEDANKSQYKMFSLLNDLKMYDPKNLVKIRSKEELLINAKKIFIITQISLRHLRTRFFHLRMDFKK